MSEEAILEVKGLATGFQTERGLLRAVDDVSFSVPKGKTIGVVGESGCGKSVTAMSVVGLLPKPSGRVMDGEILFQGKDLARATTSEMHAIRGAKIGVIFQEPMTALNPVHRIGKQVSELFLVHGVADKREAWERSIKALRMVGIPAPEIRATEYPHQLSGGMRQRVMIAMALALKPALLIADEPTTALDVTVQAQILELIQSLRREMGMSVIMITHDLGVIAETCDEVVVMYAGRVVEKAGVFELFESPRHAYTKGLLASIPRLDNPRKSKLSTIPGMVASLPEMVSGCRFCQRVGNTGPTIETRYPLIEASPGHWVEDCPKCHVRAGNESA